MRTGQRLLEATARLVDVASVSHEEEQIADLIEEELRSFAGERLEVARIGNNVLARTDAGRPLRMALAGHLDTVPANGNEKAVIEGEILHGLGSADMKGGDAVLLELARWAAGGPELAADVTWLFYVCEEVERRFSGLLEIEKCAPEWLVASAAVLAEPTGALVEAGCQGVLRLVVEARGERAHTARPWGGKNAIHLLGPVIDAVAAYEPRRPTVGGLKYREALQAVRVAGGVANNVVPDRAELVLNHRFAPDRTGEEACGEIEAVVRAVVGEEADLLFRLDEVAAAAPPGLEHPLLRQIVERSGEPPRAKLGWTDVSFFSERKIPALNFGPGDPLCAHTAGECVSAGELEKVYDVLEGVLTGTN